MHVLHTECSMNWGGQEYRTLLEHNYLNKLQGVKSWIMCHPDAALYKKAKESGAINIVPINLSVSFNLYVSIKILVFCLNNKIRIINSHGSKDSTLCLLAYLCGYPLIRSRQITSRIKKRFSYQYACSHVIATAHAIKTLLEGVGVDGGRITVIGEGVDLSEFNSGIDTSNLRAEFNISNSDIVVVNIGMIREDKGQEYFLEAAKLILSQYNNVKFFLIGEGADDKTLEIKLKNAVELLGITKNFIMTGYRDDVASFIHLSNIVVIASTAVEAQSRIVPQAFATRRTVVSTDTGGLTELVINEQNGLVVPPKSPTEISKAISRLIVNETLRDKLAENAYQLARSSLSFENMMGKTLALYRKLVVAKS